MFDTAALEHVKKRENYQQEVGKKRSEEEGRDLRLFVNLRM
jgi:hypothetical protein